MSDRTETILALLLLLVAGIVIGVGVAELAWWLSS
jgi:hypothetical protein